MELLNGIIMYMITIKRLLITLFFATILSLSACHHPSEEWKMPNMTKLTPRLQSVFEKTKTVCFGRFMVDMPGSAMVVWGDTIAPLGIKVYPSGINEVEGMAQKFVDELKNKKAIYHNHIPLLISENVAIQPQGKIIVGYENFESINALKINGYFRINNDGIIINARPLKKEKDETIALINSIAKRLRQRTESEIPLEPGNCIEYAHLIDEPHPNKEDLLEHIRIGFSLKEFPDAHFSIYVAPSNSDAPEGDSLEAQWKRIKEDPATPEETKVLANTKFFRESPRQIHDWHTGYEVLTRSPDEEGSRSHHDFQMKFIGVPHDPFKPYADIQFLTGVADDAAGATKASLTDEEAIAVWDKITSTIRVRPTNASVAKTAGTAPNPRFPLGDLAATGRACPQTGWWTPTEPESIEGGQRQHIKAGDRMPYVVTLGEPSLWQKLKGERPTYRTAAVWKLVAYGDAPTPTTVAAQTPAITGGTSKNHGNGDSSPTKKG